jgi:hypothetical protein
MWIQTVYNAISHIESTNPGLVKKVAEFDPDGQWDDHMWEDYGNVAGAIVEPFVFPGNDPNDPEFEVYIDMCENNGFGAVKSNIMGNVDPAWIKIIDLIEKQGY